MADQKLTELTELTSFTGDEEFYVVEDDDGTPVSRRATVETVVTGLAARGLSGPLDDPGTFGGTDLGYDEEFRGTSNTLPTGWSWANQETATYRDGQGAGVIGAPSSGSDLRLIVRNLPSESTWTATISTGVAVASNAASDAHFYGLVLRQSSDGKNVMIRKASTSGFITTRSSNDNFGSPANYSAAIGSTDSHRVAFRVRRNSATSYDFQASGDGGYSWIDIDMARDMTAHMTPTQIGFVCFNNLTPRQDFAIHWFRVR